MKVISNIKDMALFSKKAKARSQTIALVPTMGALHEGHLSLIAEAKKKADIVIVSIFVNLIQFGPKEDFKKYPRDLNRDKKLLSHFDPIVIFAPKAEEMYKPDFNTSVEVSDLSEKLCGLFRPGHFKGVVTVVAKLFNIVNPDFVFFGQKDFQQLAIIKKLTGDLNYNIEIISCPTVREYDGLAMSSRNKYLNGEERKAAAALYRSLCAAKKLIDSGNKKPEKIKYSIENIIKHEPLLKMEYISIADPKTLDEVKAVKGKTLIAIAVWINKTRLIDSILVG